MINIKQLSQRYKIYDYNIGLIKATPTDVIFGNFDLCSVHWLKHKYRDRMFADPFILKETDDTLEILAEEALFLGGAATLVKLTVCTKTFQLVRRKPEGYQGDDWPQLCDGSKICWRNCRK